MPPVPVGNLVPGQLYFPVSNHYLTRSNNPFIFEGITAGGFLTFNYGIGRTHYNPAFVTIYAQNDPDFYALPPELLLLPFAPPAAAPAPVAAAAPAMLIGGPVVDSVRNAQGDTTCPICDTSLTEGGNIVAVNSNPAQVVGTPVSCGHKFHEACIRPWIDQGKRTCPVCRQPIRSLPSARTNGGKRRRRRKTRRRHSRRKN